MFRWKVPLLLCVIPASSVLAAPRLAYMREKDGEKQVMLAEADGSNARAVTKGSLWHLYPALDASGTVVAYVEGADEASLQVVTQNLKTGVVEQWTNRPGMHLHPRFSGDGRYLAFSGPYGPQGRAQIAIIDRAQAHGVVLPPGPGGAVPSGLRDDVQPEVIPSDYPCYFPALSADGNVVVFQRSRDKQKKDIVLWDRSSKKLTPLTDPEGESMAPSLSFDDRLIACTAHVDGKWDIYLRDRFNPKGPVRVTRTPGRNLAPHFRPDGSLVFASDRTGHFQLYEIPAADMTGQTFTPRPLVQGDGDFYAPSLSGDVGVLQKMMPQMPAPARSSFGAIRLGSRIYVAGGHQGHEHTYPPESFLAALEYFDLETGRWHQAAPRSVPCHGFGLAGVQKQVGAQKKSYLYAFGGFTYAADHNPKWKSLDLIERYDVAADRWEVIGNLPHPRSSNVVAQVGTKVYLIGGWDSTPRSENDFEGRFLRDIDVFDLVAETVTTSKFLLPDPLRRALSSVVIDGEILLIGGLGKGSSHFDLLDNVTGFNPATGTWRELACLPCGRGQRPELPRLPFATFAPAAGVVGKEVFVFGGMFKTGPEDYAYVNHVFSLRPGNGRWEHTGRYLTEAKGFSMVVPMNEATLGILGGHSSENGNDGPVRTFETFQAR